ncbi:MAG: type III-B CRISPR module-associated Cmr3 family protein [Acidobacteriota bacterium]
MKEPAEATSAGPVASSGEASYIVQIDPVDPLLFGDNRPARAGIDHVVRDKDPSPLVFHGAIGAYVQTACGGAWPEGVLGKPHGDILDAPADGSTAELLGYCYADPSGRLWFPKPLHFRCTRSARGWPPLAHDLILPRANEPGDEATSCPLALVLDAPPIKDEEESAMLVSARILARILRGFAGPRAPLNSNEALGLTDVYAREPRPGVGIDNRIGRADEGILFVRPYRRFKRADPDPALTALGYGFTAWFRCRAPLELVHTVGDVGFLGGDRMRARLSFRLMEGMSALEDMKEEVANAVAGTRGLLAYLLTPMIWDGAWPKLDKRGPIAASIGRAQYASGWNAPHGHPRPLHVLVPAGSVFFYEWPNGRPDPEIVRKGWLSSVSQRGACAGFGRVLVGVWR